MYLNKEFVHQFGKKKRLLHIREVSDRSDTQNISRLLQYLEIRCISNDAARLP